MFPWRTRYPLSRCQEAVMRHMSDEALLRRLSEKMGGVPGEALAAAGLPLHEALRAIIILLTIMIIQIMMIILIIILLLLLLIIMMIIMIMIILMPTAII